MKRKTVEFIKKIILVVLTIALLIAIIDFKYMISVDKSFIRAMQRGIYAGWEQPGEESDLRIINGSKNTDFIDKEWESVGRFEAKNFTNAKLGELAREYVKALEECKIIKETINPETKFNEFWDAFSEPYGRRLKAIYKIYNEGFQLTAKNNKYYEEEAEMIVQGWALCKTDEINFSAVANGEGKTVLTATVKNDSGYNFEYIEIAVELYDIKDKKVETVTAIKNNIREGQKFQLRCYGSTAEAVSSYVVSEINCKRSNLMYEKNKKNVKHNNEQVNGID